MALQTIYLLSFNNYYNRIIKKLNTVSDYVNNADNYWVKSQFNFIPNDGINTKLVFNISQAEMIPFQPNYALVVDDENTFTRWFILDSTRNSGGQYTFSLKRDVLADSLETVLDAPMFIEKATIPFDNPLIFNSENMSYNQIKTEEILLSERNNNIAWIVGYIARGDEHTPVKSYTGSIDISADNDYISMAGTSSQQFMAQYDNTTEVVPSSIELRFGLTHRVNANIVHATTIRNKDGITSGNIQDSYFNYINSYNFVDKTDYVSAVSYFANNQLINKNVIRNMAEIIFSTSNYADIQNINNLNGKKIKTSDGTFLITVKVEHETKNSKITYSTYPAQYATLDNAVRSHCNPSNLESAHNAEFKIEAVINKYKVQLDQIFESGTTLTYNIPETRQKLVDSPYDMFCIPYPMTSEYTVWTGTDEHPIAFSFSSDLSYKIASYLSTALGSTIYDLQILPYSPIRAIVEDEGTTSISLVDTPLVQNVDYTYIMDGATRMGIMFFPNKSAFSMSIKLSNPITIDNPKISNEVDLYRLNSPNHNGIFEFSAAKNGGVEYFDVDCVYKPINPYIHIAPRFSGLYGQDFNDARGLTCGGDFSLPRVSSAWTEYELQNKNYQAIFDRQIAHMDFNNNMAFVSDIVGAASGTAQGAVLGHTIFGSMTSAGISGIASAGAGAIDVALNKSIRDEDMRYTKDNFGYQLGNIKAIPNSLSKTSAFTPNNKIFPFLEYYTCSDAEREALKNKLKYDGMTVMAVGTINDYILNEESFIKGRLIRFNDKNFDTHYANTVYEELSKGIYIGKETIQ